MNPLKARQLRGQAELEAGRRVAVLLLVADADELGLSVGEDGDDVILHA
jgi:hypothetical protein